MKLYNSIGPNPKLVRMFMAEKGIEVPQVWVDLMKLENRQGDYLKVNPHGQCPALELDDGQVICEVTVICEYLEDTHPEPPLIGRSPKQKAEARMWARRVDLNICEPMANGFRFGEGLEMFKERIVCVPEAADGLKRIAQDRLSWLDRQMDGKSWIVGERLTLADLLLFAWVNVFKDRNQPLPADARNLQAWFERMAARPSAEA
jgi:glutathione S-transferase